MNTMVSITFDIFCKVIDNFGDAGVCLRLARSLASKGHKVQLYCDNLDTIHTICSDADLKNSHLQIFKWQDARVNSLSEVVILAFSCRADSEFVSKIIDKKSLVINLEYLSAETWVEGCHMLSSFVDGLNCYYFFPGFTKKTGGLIVEDEFIDKIVYKDKIQPPLVVSYQGLKESNTRYITLFSYENKRVLDLIEILSRSKRHNVISVFSGKSLDNINRLLSINLKANDSYRQGNITIRALDMLDQNTYDDLLLSSDLNVVRGEDSIVRAMLCGIPFLWQIYVQDEKAHIKKLNEFIDRIEDFNGSDKTTQDMRKFFNFYNNEGSFKDSEFDYDSFEKDYKELCKRWSLHLIANGSLTDKLTEFCRIKLALE